MHRVPYEEVETLSVVKTIEELDAAAYWAANPDVRRAGLSAEEHFLRYGAAEKRKQFAYRAIERLRRQKLSGVYFRYPPIGGQPASGPLDYLPQAVKNSFEIPNDPPRAANNYNPEIVEIIRQNPDSKFLDVGAGVRFTCYSNVITTEIWPAASTDVVCIGEDLPFSDAQFDHVFCLAVLEHTKRPWVATKEIIRVTKPGGVIRIDWPFLQPVHGYPHHYFNATPKGHVSQFEADCDIVSCSVREWQHPIYTLSWLLEEWKNGLPEEERPAFYGIKIGDLIGSIPHRTHLAKQPFCKRLSADAQATICAGTTLIAVKR